MVATVTSTNAKAHRMVKRLGIIYRNLLLNRLVRQTPMPPQLELAICHKGIKNKQSRTKSWAHNIFSIICEYSQNQSGA